MKISKFNSKRSKVASKAVKTTKIEPNTASSFRHEFRVLTADDVNKQRSSAYQYLVF